MKTYLKPFLLSLPVIATAALAGCESDQPANQPGSSAANDNQIRFLCYQKGESRATDTSFETSDKIGVFMTQEGEALQIGGNEINNELFSYNGSDWSAGRPVYWNSGKHNVFAYYPYQNSIGDIENFTFKVQTNQSTHQALTASDFLWASLEGVSASSSAVPLIFSHSMSKAIIEISKGEGYEGELPGDMEVYLLSTVTTATIDLSTGGVSKDPYAPTESIKAEKLSPTTFQAIVVPQNIETRRPIVEVVTSGISYLMEAKISFRQGYKYVLNVSLSQNPSQTKIEIGGGIGGWN